MLDRRADEFAWLLDQLAGHVEWGVKVYALPPAPGSPEPAAVSAAADTSPGRDYLRSRQRQRRSGEDAWRAAHDAVLRIDAAARGLAVDRVQHRLQEGELATGPGYNVSNNAYLVPRERGEEFQSQLLGAAESLDGIRVDITGPWAPYSFTASDDTDDAQETHREGGAEAETTERKAGTQ